MERAPWTAPSYELLFFNNSMDGFLTLKNSISLRKILKKLFLTQKVNDIKKKRNTVSKGLFKRMKKYQTTN